MRRRIPLRPVHRIAAGLAVTTVSAVVLSIGAHPTAASWVSTAELGHAVGTASSTCTTPGVYRTTATGRFLAGAVAGTPVSGSSAPALTAGNPASTAVFSPGAAPRGGDGASSTVANSAVASALQAAGGVAALTAPSGSQTQYAGATSTGTSTAGSGAITTAGVVDGAGIAAGTRPAVGALDVSGALAAVPGGTAAAGSLSRLGLTIGSAASTASLNECARRWGASLSSALSRTATVSALTLTAKDDALTTLLGAVSAQQGAVSSAFGGITGTDGTSSAASSVLGTARTGLTSAVTQTLTALGIAGTVGTATGSVVIGADLGSASSATAAVVRSGTVAVDGGARTLAADLTPSATPSANTPLLTSAAVSGVVTGTGAAAGALVSGVDAAWEAAASGATMTVHVSVPVTQGGLPLLTVDQTMAGTLADFASTSTTWPAPVVQVLGPVDGSRLLAALQPNVATLLIAPVRSTTASAVRAPLGSAVSGAESALAGALGDLRSALPGQLTRLTDLISVTVDEQPDVAPFPAAASGIGGGFTVTALRVHVRAAGAEALDLAIASSSVGPDTTINQ